MSRTFVLFSSLSAVGILAGIVQAQDSTKTQFTARELYYAAAQAPEKQATKPLPKPMPPKGATTPPKPVVVDATNTTQPVPTSSPRPPQGGTLPGGGRVLTASTHSTAPAPTEGPALGLKYTILKLVDGQMVEVPSDTVFHAGDRIRFNVETNGTGYLYIVSQGSSGTWRPMFPAPELEDGNNRVEGFHAYTMPPGGRYSFDEQAGSEKVFIVLSRAPEADLEKIIYSLQGGKNKPVSQPSAPAPSSGQTLIASASIDNSMVGRLRMAYARDLIVEKITDETPGDRKEKAVYVVNPTGSKDSRVVADLTLVHK